MTPPPDLPRREPTPSIAAFPLSLDSLLKGMKEISFVASNRVYLEARQRQFCTAPRKTLIMRGVEPKRAATQVKQKFSKRTKVKKATPVKSIIAGGIMAAVAQENRRITLLVMKTAVMVATIPIHVMISPM